MRKKPFLKISLTRQVLLHADCIWHLVIHSVNPEMDSFCVCATRQKSLMYIGWCASYQATYCRHTSCYIELVTGMQLTCRMTLFALAHQQSLTCATVLVCMATPMLSSLTFGIPCMQEAGKSVVYNLSFAQAWNEDARDTLKLIAHLRDVRDGKAEQKAFRLCVKWLYKKHPLTLIENLVEIVQVRSGPATQKIAVTMNKLCTLACTVHKPLDQTGNQNIQWHSSLDLGETLLAPS